MIDRTTLEYDRRCFTLDVGTDIEALQAEVVSVCRTGGGMVSFTTATQERIALLVSSGTPVSFETRQVDAAGVFVTVDVAEPFDLSDYHLDY